MRQFRVTLAQNLGTKDLGVTLDVSSARVELGGTRWEADKELTKLAPGDMTLKLADVDGSIWTWLQTQIQSEAGLLPPFLFMDVDDERVFAGTVDPSRITQIPKSREISMTAQDWSAMAASKYLGPERPEDDWDPEKNPWLRPYPNGTAHARPQESFLGNIVQGVFGGANHDLMNGFEWGPPKLLVGDLVQLSRLPGQTFKAERVITGVELFEGQSYPWWQAHLPGLWQAWRDVVQPTDQWDFHVHNEQWQDTYTRLARPTGPQNWYTVQKTIGHDEQAPCYVIPLDTVDGIVPGDSLRCIGTTRSDSWTVLQVDAAGLCIITREEVRDISQGTTIFFTQESLGELVYEDARATLSKAIYPFRTDFSRYSPPTLTVPVLVWLPLRSIIGEDITSVRDMDQGLANLRVFGAGAIAWDGTPEDGWREAVGALPRAHWTDQVTVAPSSLMPDEIHAPQPTATTPLSPDSPKRYRPSNLAWRSRSQDPEDPAPGQPGNPGTWSPTNVPTVVLYDYLLMRRIQIADRAITINTWSGAAWGAPTVATWPDPSTVKSACVFPGGPAGMVLGLTSNGIVGAVLPSLSSQTAVCVIPAEAQDAVLRTTPWGAFLVGSRGYGRISYVAGSLQISWVNLIEAKGGTLLPNTFTGVDSDHVMVMGRFDGLDTDGKTVTETRLLLLKPVPTTTEESVVWDERILEGAPITCGAMRDPSQASRAVGHCGGRLFQVSAQLPLAYALERFTPSGMRAGELVEHICQVLNAVAFPDPSGTMHIVSRGLLEAPISLEVANLEIQEARTWEHFYTSVRVSGEPDDVYADVPGPGEPVPEGKLLEVSGQPLLWTLSGCEAMARALHAWFSVPRRMQKQTWVWADPNSAAPWESLPPLARIRLNGGDTVWMVIGMEDRRTLGEAKVTLLEVE